MQVRVIGSIFVATTLVMIVLGLLMVSVVTQRIVDSKIDVANSEIDRARVAVEEQVAATASGTSTQARLNSVRAALTNQNAQMNPAASYEPVLLVSNRDDTVTTAPENFHVPERLRYFVNENQISYQFSAVSRTDGSTYNALLIGTPANTDIPGLQVYLVLSMEADESTVALMRGIISAAAIVVVVLLVGIAFLLSQQVITPVRAASRIAERLANGHLRERMSVEGEDEVARLAMSFNSMAESLSKQIEQLQEYGKLQEQFTSDVSHELRTPLTTMRMAADFVLEHDEDLSAPTRRSLELLQGQLDHFEKLLEDLLEISRHDAQAAALSVNHVDVRDCIYSAWGQVRKLAEELGVEVRFHNPEVALDATVEPRRVERILRNLLANAIDHSEGNPVDVHWARNDTTIAVTVTDSGVGLRKGDERHIFNRFWRADSARVRHSGGTGLGLAIAQEDAHLHGGVIEAVGTAGVGSQFRLALPIEPNKPLGAIPLDLVTPVAKEVPESAGGAGTVGTASAAGAAGAADLAAPAVAFADPADPANLAETAPPAPPAPLAPPEATAAPERRTPDV
ncbi:MtrAB system histidine kinase MtrB [Corynebacterium caspium]|uniref:MtrAB system histidine kinase MtrB n=1 Tax=Corynebacterium caspium TaxID=234828 RepID=UPI000A06569A|nr:MtrAB system histidine kinase MtrB [Corynebacterium caspium]